MLDSLENVAGSGTRALATDELDEAVLETVCSWSGAFDVEKALSLGFAQDTNFDDVVRQYQEQYVR
ncbi:hypothetical protein [uncultured Rothia sp.]|uniref:hypothetical protein n=1 Tax=uncultured Rothia sp. TaxID=316088 RepID=UPI003217AAE3